MNIEKEKYINIYSGELGSSYFQRHNEGYGRGFWAGGIIEYIKSIKPESICDVGCGAGRFCVEASDFVNNIYGVDIASVLTDNTIKNGKVKYLDGEAKSVPLPDKSVEYITSFDCLEHCPPEDIDIIFKEFYRVATKGIILSVSSLHDSHDGVELHLTVEPQSWWVEKLKQYGDVFETGVVPDTKVPYIICNFKG